MTAIAWAIVLASLIIFEGLTWQVRDTIPSFVIMIFEVSCFIGIIKS